MVPRAAGSLLKNTEQLSSMDISIRGWPNPGIPKRLCTEAARQSISSLDTASVQIADGVSLAGWYESRAAHPAALTMCQHIEPAHRA
jgi:hypothetical protein